MNTALSTKDIHHINASQGVFNPKL